MSDAVTGAVAPDGRDPPIGADAYPTPYDGEQIAQSYDSCIIGEITTPGVCEVSGWARKIKWDTKPQLGKNFASASYQGVELCAGSVKITVCDAEGFRALRQVKLALCASLVTDPPTALSIYHPQLADIGVYWVVPESIGQLETSSSGLWSQEFGLQEYAPPSTPQGGSGGAAQPGAPFEAAVVDPETGEEMPGYEDPPAIQAAEQEYQDLVNEVFEDE